MFLSKSKWCALCYTGERQELRWSHQSVSVDPFVSFHVICKRQFSTVLYGLGCCARAVLRPRRRRSSRRSRRSRSWTRRSWRWRRRSANTRTLSRSTRCTSRSSTAWRRRCALPCRAPSLRLLSLSSPSAWLTVSLSLSLFSLLSLLRLSYCVLFNFYWTALRTGLEKGTSFSESSLAGAGYESVICTVHSHADLTDTGAQLHNKCTVHCSNRFASAAAGSDNQKSKLSRSTRTSTISHPYERFLNFLLFQCQSVLRVVNVQ